MKTKIDLSIIDIDLLIGLAIRAGEQIMDIYELPIEVEFKKDESPLTVADKKSNTIIIAGLKKLYPEFPIISEETRQEEYSIRKNWDICWLVDPLDGTKEFIKKNGEFTINIALVVNHEPVVGIVYLPAKSIAYYGIKGKGAFKLDKDKKLQEIHCCTSLENNTLRVAGSRSHQSAEMDAYLEKKKNAGLQIQYTSAGSSLKFCLVAEGLVDEYPRFGPTLEWDTAAGHAIVLAAGGKVLKLGFGDSLKYNKQSLYNPFFIAKGQY